MAVGELERRVEKLEQRHAPGSSNRRREWLTTLPDKALYILKAIRLLYEAEGAAAVESTLSAREIFWLESMDAEIVLSPEELSSLALRLRPYYSYEDFP